MTDKELATKKLHSYAAEHLGKQYDREFINEFRDSLNYPEFENKTHRTNWQHYVPEEIQQLWHFLDEMARISIWLISFNRVLDQLSSED